MKIIHFGLLAAVLSVLSLGAATAQGATVSCDVYAALNRYHYAVTLDTQSGALDIRTDDGYIVKGNANYSHSVRSGFDLFHLQTDFTQGYQIELENGGAGRIAFCVQANECYSCRPRTP